MPSRSRPKESSPESLDIEQQEREREREQAGSQDPEKPRLSEDQKKSNHIASEQKRRQAIREGFDRLTQLVPGLEGQGRSESVVLKKTVDFMRESLEERKRLVREVQERGGDVEGYRA